MSKIAWKGNGDILLASIKHRSIVFFTRRITFGRKESGTRAIVVEIFARDRLANQSGMPPTWLTGSESTLGTESRPTLVGDAMSQRRLLARFCAGGRKRRRREDEERRRPAPGVVLPRQRMANGLW